MGNIILPAEAPFDLYKAAYVFYQRRNLRLCHFTFVYPNKQFSTRNGDVLLGINVDTGNQTVTKFARLSEVMDFFGDNLEFRFIYQISDDVYYGFKNKDKTRTLDAVFTFFDNYRQSMAELMGFETIIGRHNLVEVNGLKIVVQEGEAFISPDERIVLFRSGIDYVVWSTNQQPGIQKNLCSNVPTLSSFAKSKFMLAGDWFVPSKGHMLVAKAGGSSKEDLTDGFLAYLSDTKERAVPGQARK